MVQLACIRLALVRDQPESARRARTGMAQCASRSL